MGQGVLQGVQEYGKSDALGTDYDNEKLVQALATQ